MGGTRGVRFGIIKRDFGRVANKGMEMNVAFQKTQIGMIGIVENAGTIVQVAFEGEPVSHDVVRRGTPLLSDAFRQLDAYLAGQLRTFTLPLAPEGTPFQKKIWRILEKIPYGKTLSYKDVAIRAGNSKATRAVGMANNRNPIPIFIPCHRVIGADGKLVGYGGGLDMKARLLAIEGWRG